MFLVTYTDSEYADGSGKLTNKQKLFNSDEDQSLFIKGLISKSKNSNIKLWVPQSEVNIDYKQKFEELYDHLLKNIGVRGDKIPEKPMYDTNKAKESL